VGVDEADIEKSQPACKEMNTYPAPASYLRQAAALNVAEPWMKLGVPVLAIYGTADFITTPGRSPKNHGHRECRASRNGERTLSGGVQHNDTELAVRSRAL
jgi:hypothetical protein